MRILIQKVLNASVNINGTETREIGRGLLIFVGIEDRDTDEDVRWLSQKAANIRIFEDENNVMNLSVKDVGGEILLISQFTLQALTKKGNRPSYIRASKPDIAVPLYEVFIEQLKDDLGRDITTGQFGADMKVTLVNDGPTTIWIDSQNKE